MATADAQPGATRVFEAHGLTKAYRMGDVEVYALRGVAELAPPTPILPHTTYLGAPIRQAARQRGAYEVVVRGELNPLWAAAHKLLVPGPTPAEHPAA